MKKDFVIGYLAGFLVASSIELVSRWMTNPLDTLEFFVPLSIKGPVDFLPKALLASFSYIDSMTATVVKNVNTMIFFQFCSEPSEIPVCILVFFLDAEHLVIPSRRYLMLFYVEKLYQRPDGGLLQAPCSSLIGTMNQTSNLTTCYAFPILCSSPR